LVEELGLAQSTISQHLKELKQAGLIKGNIEGTSVCYCIDTQIWKKYQSELGSLFSAFKPGGNCC
jgi:DNA-binding transcriptional ArsR family regulator